jgi:DNA-binding CsgD family transcriptional regulator
MNPLIGREHVLSTWHAHLAAVRQGAGGCLVVEGPFGIGKTHLLKAMAVEGAERGLTVVTGQGNRPDLPAPIHPLINLLRHVMPDAADFDELVRPDRNPFWLMDRVGELVESAARRRPLVLVLDDAQRIDDVSGLALRGLVQSLASSPVLWLLARRPVPTRSLAQHALGWLIDHAAVRLALGALEQGAVAALCARLLGAEPDASVLAWAERCGGNPWLLERLFTALREEGQVVIVDGTASVVADRLPDGVLTAVGRLLDGMPRAVRPLLVSGRRIGRAFTVEEAAVSLGEPVTELAASAEEAVHAGLVRRDGERLTFPHGLVEEALLHVSFQERSDAADAHPGQPGQPVQPRPTAQATPAAPAAPRSPACGCGDVVARALATLGDVFDGVPRTLAPALRLLAGAGRGAEATRLAEVALRPGVEAAAEAQLVLELSRGLRDAGCPGMSGTLLRRTLTRQDIGEAERAGLHAALAEISQGTGGGSDAVVAPSANPAAGPAPSGWAPRQAAVPAHCAACERPLWTWLVRALVAADRFEEASAVCDAVKQDAEKYGEAWPETLWHGHHAELLTAAGRLEEARGEAEAALRLADRSAPQDSVPARLVLARLSLHRGDLATASDQLRMTERLVTGDGGADKARLDWALAQFHAAGGRPAMMVRTLVDVDGRVEPDPLLFSEAPPAAAMLVRLAKHTGLDAEAARAAGFARRIAERNPAVQSLAGGAEHAEGVLRNDMVALHRAVELHRQADRPLAAGSALEDAAEVERGMGNKTRTVRLLESAVDLYLHCGAQRDLARVQKKLRRLGVHTDRGPAAERPKSGWESLTGAELRVVRAIVDGKTNREAASSLFLSPHTVDSHLRRVFSKLDINSRVELTKHFLAHEALSPARAAARRPGSAG